MARPGMSTRSARRPSATSTAVTIDQVLRPNHDRDIRQLPRLLLEALRLVRAASRRQFRAAIALQVVASLSLAAQLLIVARVTDRVAGASTLDVASLAPELLLLGGLLVVAAVATLAQSEQRTLLGEHVTKHTTAHVMEVSSSVDLIRFDDPSFYDRLQRARVNASVRPTQIANGVIGLTGAATAVSAVVATLLFLEPIVVAVILLGGIPTLVTNRLASRAFHQYSVRQTPNDRRRAYLYDTLTNREPAHEVRAFDSRAYVREEHDRRYDEKLEDLRSTLRRRFVYGAVNAVAAAIITTGTLAMLLWFVEIGRLDVGAAAAAVAAVILVASRMRALTSSTGSLYEGALFLSDFTTFIDDYRVSPASSGAKVEPFRTIELEQVSFTYPSRTAPSLTDVSLTIRRGEVVALVGENGSGKTTLTKLLAGLYRPDAGVIRWDGRDLAEADLSKIREHTGVIFQDFVRYFFEVRQNIAISRAEEAHDDGRVHRAAVRAGAARFVDHLPDGYDTLLGPAFVGGSDLSLGQWQRIALARAYFRDAPLLILDEPTASLDPRGEYEIFQQVRELAAGRTIVLVSHRFASVRAADRIVVLNRGRIVEEGSHDDLLRNDGLYRELFTLQAEGYRDGPTTTSR